MQESGTLKVLTKELCNAVLGQTIRGDVSTDELRRAIHIVRQRNAVLLRLRELVKCVTTLVVVGLMSVCIAVNPAHAGSGLIALGSSPPDKIDFVTEISSPDRITMRSDNVNPLIWDGTDSLVVLASCSDGARARHLECLVPSMEVGHSLPLARPIWVANPSDSVDRMTSLRGNFYSMSTGSSATSSSGSLPVSLVSCVIALVSLAVAAGVVR